MNKKSIFFILKFITSILLLWFVTSNFELGPAVDRFEDIKYGYLFTAIFIFVVLLVNNTARWVVVLRAIDADLPFKVAIKIMYISIFFNQTLPSSIGGDAFKIFLARKAGINLKTAVNCVMLERAIALLGLILLVVLTQPFLLVRVEDHPAKYLFPLLAGLALVGILIMMSLDHLPKDLQRLRIVGWLVHLASDTKKLFLTPHYTFTAILLGISGNICLAMIAYFTFCALLVEVSVLDCLVLIPPVILIMTLPISIAGWGVREGAMVGAFAFVGVAEGDAFVVSLLFGILNVIFAIPGGFLWLMGDYNRAEVRDEIK
jgi:uncharacterized protein (TIRG00374 family)